MIPIEKLKKLKPLSDQVKRMKAIKKKRSFPGKRINLSYDSRQRAFYPARFQRNNYNGPKGVRPIG